MTVFAKGFRFLPGIRSGKLFSTMLTDKLQDKILFSNCKQKSLIRHDVTAYITITIKPEILRILHHDIWGTVSVFIVDLNADIRGGFTNLTADNQKLRLDIGVGI